VFFQKERGLGNGQKRYKKGKKRERMGERGFQAAGGRCDNEKGPNGGPGRALGTRIEKQGEQTPGTFRGSGERWASVIPPSTNETKGKVGEKGKEKIEKSNRATPRRESLRTSVAGLNERNRQKKARRKKFEKKSVHRKRKKNS